MANILMAAILAVFIALFLAPHANGACLCENPAWCAPIAGQRVKEIVAFTSGTANMKKYDWASLTTIVGAADPLLVCEAHSHGVRMLLSADFNFSNLVNATARSAWVEQHVAKANAIHADGSNFDYEAPLNASDPRVASLVALMQETKDAFHAHVGPDTLVVADMPWSPSNIDGRFYDVVGMAQAVDLFFVMSYCLRSQVYDRCIASAGSGLPGIQLGIEQYVTLGVPKEKLVMGLTWGGLDYSCVGTKPGEAKDAGLFCPIQPVEFYGAPCSDLVAFPGANYDKIMALSKANAAVRQWEPVLASPYFNYVNASGDVHQVWYDDAQSLTVKNEMAKGMGVRGVGVFYLDALDYSSTDPAVQEENKKMYASLAAFL